MRLVTLEQDQENDHDRNLVRDSAPVLENQGESDQLLHHDRVLHQQKKRKTIQKVNQIPKQKYQIRLDQAYVRCLLTSANNHIIT